MARLSGAPFRVLGVILKHVAQKGAAVLRPELRENKEIEQFRDSVKS
jgi:hypothetical protein